MEHFYRKYKIALLSYLQNFNLFENKFFLFLYAHLLQDSLLTDM